MKILNALITSIGLFTATCILAPQHLLAQDPVVVDSLHNNVILENDQIRVMHVTYLPHEKSPLHNHPDGVVVFLTDAALRITQPDGKTVEISTTSGQVVWSPATVHQIENTGDKPFELIHIDLKCRKGSE